jgi:dinuclear metal center YbgI/SA1388 family protein
MKVRDILSIINKFAPFLLQEEYDNSGVQLGNLDQEIGKILISLDLTVDSVKEANKNGVNIIITHHPVMFKPLNRITKQDTPAIYEALRNDINVISVHTNFDISNSGLNDYVANLLSLKKIEPIIESTEKIYKFSVYVPEQYADKVTNAIFTEGAGKIGNYDQTSFTISGTGTFRPLKGAKPFLGKRGAKESVKEVKIETVVPERLIDGVVKAMKSVHPYEEPAFDIYSIKTQKIEGIGAICEIEKSLSVENFSKLVKKNLNASYVRLTLSKNTNVKRIGLCTGSGRDLIKDAFNKNIDLYITGDIDYHTALFAQDKGMNLLDVEHYETEKFFVDAMFNKLAEYGLSKKLLLKSKTMKSPFKII